MPPPGATEFTQDRFDAEVLGADRPVLVGFGADWCAPCRRLEPMLDELAESVQGQAVVGRIDTDVYPELRARFSISAIPTVLVFHEGEVVQKLIGVMSLDELVGALQQAVKT